jgi:hypothetical protein
MDAMLAKNGATAVAAGATVSDWTANPVAGTGGAVEVLSPSYLRSSPTKWSYTYGTDGKITAVNTVNGITC